MVLLTIVLLTIVVAATSLVLGVLWGRRMARRHPGSRVERSAASSPGTYDLVEKHRDGFVLADGGGRVVYRNAAARLLQGTHVGLLVDEAIDRHVSAAIELGHSDEVLQLYGPPKVVLVVEARHLGDRGVVVYIEDISEQRRIDQVRTDFVANISHELKTPVGAMSVLAETLEDETDPETVQRVVERLMSEAERATRTIDDLMELSRIELGGESEREPVAVGSVIDEAMGRVKELAARHGIGISNLAAAGHLDGLVVHGDRRQLVSALGNLVENAVKYSEPDGKVTIRTRLDSGPNGRVVEIAVIDQGVGIPQRDIDRIFERFYRVDRARSRMTGGTGLGLSIVRHVAHNHGGGVEVESTEGEGSTFTLRLPEGDRETSGDANVADHVTADEPAAKGIA